MHAQGLAGLRPAAQVADCGALAAVLNTGDEAAEDPDAAQDAEDWENAAEEDLEDLPGGIEVEGFDIEDAPGVLHACLLRPVQLLAGKLVRCAEPAVQLLAGLLVPCAEPAADVMRACGCMLVSR